MPEFLIFKKGPQIVAIEKNNQEAASRCIEQGYEKQFEEPNAPDSQRALARFTDIKKEEETAPIAWATGVVFFALIAAIGGIVSYLFL